MAKLSYLVCLLQRKEVLGGLKDLHVQFMQVSKTATEGFRAV